MGSDPQYIKFPNLSIAQHVFNLSNPACAPAVQQSSLKKLQDVILENKMAPFYRHLAHPTEGILNNSGEGVTQHPQNGGNSTQPLITSNLIASRKAPVKIDFPWDEQLYQSLLEDNKKELETFQKEEDEAEEAAGETEVQAARGKRAEFWARVGDKDKAVESHEALLEKTGFLGTKIDLVMAMLRIGLFFGDLLFVNKTIERAETLVESGGDWDRRNRLKAYKGLHLLTIRSYSLAAPSFSTVLLAGSLSLKRVDFKAKVVDAPEIKAILGSPEDQLAALSGEVSSGPGARDEVMKETTAGLPTPAGAKTAVNISSFSTGSGVPVETEAPVDFAPLANLVTSLYNGNYRSFFVALAAVEDQFLTQDRYLHEHRAWFVREMRLRAYQQLLQSYRVVGLSGMANDFGVTVDYLDRDLAKFISNNRIACTIDRVNGIIETNRPDDKNKQYADVVKHGDSLITKIQKYGQAVRLRGSERS
ncbi:hypothetical protein N7519_003410 [Penicillium mononematosum]|uniref:uncharacterized protein n=1 Tax=Penicillium mononematosum TaxID=268346 RepID=UPI002549B5D7|nr:uncharacterized protein N7519_003410 [Penicillium mononematosum]KAJ6188502.1 hypothetical protein N7519_003410 [Penicillium mononematosum]